MTRAQIEYIVAGLITVILLTFLLNAILYARTAVRDDLRRTDLTNLKRGAELYFNRHNAYPTPPNSQLECTESSDQSSWLFGNESPLLKEQHMDAIPHDVREGKNRSYRYCVTETQNQAAAGYYFETRLEVAQPDVTAFDEDETRKFNYRVLHEDGKILYRVCGGTETQCTPQGS